MILGIGNDILEIERIRKAVQAQGDRFLTRILTKKEREYCAKFKNPFPHIAGRFSAKEAIVKALGSGFGESVSLLDIEILNNKLGKPEVHFSKRLKKKIQKSAFFVSISHCRTYVTAIALWTE